MIVASLIKLLALLNVSLTYQLWCNTDAKNRANVMNKSLNLESEINSPANSIYSRSRPFSSQQRPDCGASNCTQLAKQSF